MAFSGRGSVLLRAAAAFCSVTLIGGIVSAPAAWAASARVRVTATSGTWGKAKEVPGTAALNVGGSAQTAAVSCPSPGNCGAVGNYTDRDHGFMVFAVSEVRGRWGTAKKIPGLSALAAGGLARVTSVSCPSAGNCAAGGFYVDGHAHTQAFLVTQVRGNWGTAKEVPGTKTLNVGGSAMLNSMSCASAGNCAAGGYYDASAGYEAFVVSEVGGTWHRALEVPGSASLNTGNSAAVSSVSCPSAGNCVAGGTYNNLSGSQGFVVSEVHGHWHHALDVPGLSSLNAGGGANLDTVSCSSAGNCAAGGYYTEFYNSSYEAFVVSEVGGTWRTAKEVPGTATLNKDGYAGINSISCSSAGDCGAGGYYSGTAGREAMVVSEVRGTWRAAREVPGTAALNKGGLSWVSSLSCSSPGNCGAGGSYARAGHNQAFVVSEVNGTWRTATELRGTAALNAGGNAVSGSVSCPSAGSCVSGGYYTDHSDHGQAFIATETPDRRS